MTEEKLVHRTVATRSLLWGILGGALATATIGLLVLRPIRLVVGDQYPPLPPTSSSDAPSGGPAPSLEETPPNRTDADSVTAVDTVDDGDDSAAPDAAPPDPAPSPLTPTAGTATATPAPPAAMTIGGLRVSNQTRHPLRVALLPQPEALSPDPSDAQSIEATAFNEPVHWDFAPEEGSIDGLRLSQPNGSQTIQSGDILVAFAQDGTQRYWGPYVVGATALPAWQPETQEWQLTIQSSARGVTP